jgi:hypothetical protein
VFQIIQRYYSTAAGKEKFFNKTIKKNHIVRAKSVAYIIDAKPQVEYNTEELQKIVYMIFPRRQRRECMRTRSVIITRII